MKIIINSNYNLPLKNELAMHGVVLITKSVFYYNKKFYPKVFLDECFYKLVKYV